MIRLGFAIATFHVGQYTLEGVAAGARFPAIVNVKEIDDLFAAATQYGVAMLFAQLIKRYIDREPVVFGERGEHLEIVKVAAIPPANSAFGQCE